MTPGLGEACPGGNTSFRTRRYPVVATCDRNHEWETRAHDEGHTVTLEQEECPECGGAAVSIEEER